MADEEEEKRKRRREREDELEEEEQKRKAALKGAGDGFVPRDDRDMSRHINDLIDRATGMIEQLNNLYNQYRTGVERRPPVERRRQLELIFVSLSNLPMPNSAYQFRYRSILENFRTHCERWDKLVRKVETGAKKPPGGKLW